MTLFLTQAACDKNSLLHWCYGVCWQWQYVKRKVKEADLYSAFIEVYLTLKALRYGSHLLPASYTVPASTS